jgi:hypothetical protein
MITKRATALIAALSLLGAVTPAAFAQNTFISTDDDYNVGEENHFEIFQYEVDIGRVTNDDGNSTGNTALELILQNANVTQSNNNEDNNNFNATQIEIDICAIVHIGIIC